MSKVTKNFDFITALQTGKKDFKSVKISGQYYPTQCSPENGLSYDIEEIWDGYQNAQMGWNGMHNLMTAFNVSEFNEGHFSNKVREATEAHITYLLGNPDKLVLDTTDTMQDIPDIFGSIAEMTQDFVNSKTA